MRHRKIIVLFGSLTSILVYADSVNAGEVQRRLSSALITGATRGIGKELFRRLSLPMLSMMKGTPTFVPKPKEHLRRLSTFSSNEENVQALKKEYPDEDNFLIEQVNITNMEQAKEHFDKTENKLGPVEVLVNNVATLEGTGKPFDEVTDKEIDKSIDTNFKSILSLTRHFLKKRKADKRKGVVINISSRSADGLAGGMVLYAIGKAMLNAFTTSLGAEGGHIAVLGINLPAVDTELQQEARNAPHHLFKSDVGRKRFDKSNPMLSAKEAAETIAFMIDNSDLFTSGTTYEYQQVIDIMRANNRKAKYIPPSCEKSEGILESKGEALIKDINCIGQALKK